MMRIAARWTGSRRFCEAVPEAPERAASASLLDETTEITPLPTGEIPKPGPEVAADDPARPSFDLVRIDSEGAGLIAGRAEPNSIVRILADGQEIARTTASRGGEFVAMVDTPTTEATSQIIDVVTDLPDGGALSAADPVIMLGRIASADPEAAPEPLAPVLLRSTDEGVELIQPSTLAVPDTVSLDTITYDAAAEVILVGRGVPGMSVRIYVDDVARIDVPMLSFWFECFPRARATSAHWMTWRSSTEIGASRSAVDSGP